jgi:hypothetical protein
VDLLVKNGADINKLSNSLTPLRWARLCRRDKAEKILAGIRAVENDNVRPDMFPLHVAVYKNDKPTIINLIKEIT